MPLTEEDYNKTPSIDCRSFSEVLVEAKNEWRHIIPFKLTEQGLEHFLIGYNMQEKLEAVELKYQNCETVALAFLAVTVVSGVP